MTFRILDLASASDMEHWRDPPPHMRDVHFDQAYLRAYMQQEHNLYMCALTEDDDGFVMQPFVVRDDVIGNVYGYGGMAGSMSVGIRVIHEDSFRKWAEHEGLSMRYRFHPLSGGSWIRSDMEKEIVYIDLGDRLDIQLRKGHASSVKKARKAGVSVRDCPDVIRLFGEIYAETMDRLDADDHWYWDSTLLERLKIAYPQGFGILLAFVGDEVEAGCVLLGSHGTCYYHYAGSRGIHRDIGVGNLLVVEASAWAHSRGFRILHLGGGKTADPDDSLLRFKSGFSKRRAWVYRYCASFAGREAQHQRDLARARKSKEKAERTTK